MRSLFCCALILCATFAIPPIARSQMTEEEIDSLRLRIAAKDWSFSVGLNPATQYPAGQPGGARRPDNWREIKGERRSCRG